MMPQRKARLTAVLSVVFSSVAICNCAASNTDAPQTAAQVEDHKTSAETAGREATEDQMAERLESLDRRLRKVEPDVEEKEEEVLETARDQRRDVGNALALLVVTTDRNWPIAKQDLELRLAALEINLEQLEQ